MRGGCWPRPCGREVEAYIAQFADVRDEKGHRLVVRNGCHGSRTVTTSAGAVDVTAPRVNDKRVDPDTGERQRFVVDLAAVGAQDPEDRRRCCRCCTCTGSRREDFVPALGQFLGSAKGLSASTITKLHRDVERPSSRRSPSGDLSGVRTSCTCGADGIHVNVRLDDQKLCLLVMIGVRADGRKELVALTDGYREAAESWADLLRDCRRRGMRAPVLAAGDGALGISGARCARCSRRPASSVAGFHKISNVLAALPKSAHPGAKKALGDLERRGQVPRPRRGQGVRVDLWCEVSEGGRQDQRRRRAAAGVLRASRPSTGIRSENYKSDRIWTFATVRNRSKITKGPGLRAPPESPWPTS